MKYHLIGVQGVSMRGIKKYLEFLGHVVTGSDLKTGGHMASNITKDIDCVVRTSAVNPGSPGWVEVEAAEKLNIPVIKRSKLIGDLFREKRLIAVSGMHGKTTVTAMAGLAMIDAEMDPTVLVGDGVKEFDGDVIRIGQSQWVVFEACEYDRSFLDFYPEILILTNIEEEHLDTYPGGLAEIKEAFLQYLSHVSQNGVIIACHDDKNVVEVVEKAKADRKVIYYGRGTDYDPNEELDLSVPGFHNKLNARAVMALCDYLGINREISRASLQKFTGAKRRFEKLGNYNGADLIDDYGHHPSEIRSTLQALKEKYPEKKKFVVFWPHQYKRIKPLMDDFAAALKEGDEVILKPIYFVPGRDEVLDISSQDLAKKICDLGTESLVFETDEQISDYLKERLDADSVLLTIGIPPVYKVIEKIMEQHE